ncbi:S28 family serine protease [Gaetbulibacter saemankumensis]|uniref:S28 family serine protease n=1 Tax=Gaetbulibacter saemankumensis TaxID=311208 RepID=UPI00041A1124|nr:S28 family serine protease [Gaetbulibacter saemankumensis]
MKRYSIILLFSFICFTKLIAQSASLETLLFELPDVSFEKIETPEGYQSAYMLKVKQPIDHSDTSKGYFHQKVYLSHLSFDAPSVIITQGYTKNSNSIFELSRVLKANQIDVEHRYFGDSSPKEIDYDYLNLKQVTADLHHIRTLLGNIYKNKWVSTGVSKGGSTTVFYRYFYPEDVDVSVPYVAPINNSFEDKRIYKFFDTIGTAKCRNKIQNFQKDILKNREEILPLLKFYSLGRNVHYSYLSLEEAFELTVLEYPFSFWQWGTSCEDIPFKNASIEDKTKHLIKVCDMSFFADETMTKYASHYYQSAEEFGYYGYETKDFKKLLKALPKGKNPHAAFTPNHMKVPFKGDELLSDVSKWLKKKGDHFIYIYGGNDTWSATGVPKSKSVDSQWFVLKGKHHGNARIKNFTDSERARFNKTINDWLGLELE